MAPQGLIWFRPAMDHMTERKYDPSYPNFLAPLVGFRSRKAAQICTYFALENGGLIEKLKLIILVYLSERACLAENHRPMLFDELFSLPHGPICSRTLNGIDGEIRGHIWDDFVARNGNEIVALKKFTREDFDEISDAEMDILERTWGEFGHMTASQLRNYSHDHCPEHTETAGRIPISYRDLLEALGASDAEAELVDREISEFRREESALIG
jgi:uncharacterized phage-associated protein